MYAWTERSGFLLAGDAVRLGAVIRLLCHLLPEGSVGHVSAASQALFAVAYLTRYLGFFVQFTSYYDFFVNVSIFPERVVNDRNFRSVRALRQYC